MASNDRVRVGSGWLRKLTWFGMGLILLLLGTWLALTALGNSTLAAAEAAWSADPDFQAVAALEREETNDSALRLQTLTAALGIDIEPKHAGRIQPKFGTEYPKAAVGEWLKAALASDGSSVPPAPAEVAEFLDLHAAEVHALSAHLTSSESPLWPLDLERGFEAPIPNLLGHMHAMRLLVSTALVADAAGRGESTQTALEATWALSASLGTRPELICQLIRVAMLRHLAATVRLVDCPAEPWLERFAGLDLRGEMRRAFAGEAHGTLAFARDGHWRDAMGENSGEVLPWVLERAVPQRFFVAREVLTLRHLVAELDALDPCTGDPSDLSAKLVAAAPWWDVMTRILLPNLDGAWTRALQAELEVALTRSVLASRQARASGAPAPAPLALRCAAWSFREDTTPSGGFRLIFDGALPWSPGDAGPLYPLSHAEPGPPAVALP